MRILLTLALVAAGSFTFVQTAFAEEAGVDSLDLSPETYRLAVETGPTLIAADSIVRPRCRQARRKDWQLSIAPYGWLASAQGTAYTDGVGQDFKVPVEDSIAHTNFGYQLITTARWKRGFVFLDVTRAHLSGGDEDGRIAVDVQVEQWLVEFGVGYQVLGPALSDQARRCPTLDLFVGGRYQSTEVKLRVDSPIGGISRGGTDDWVDPFIGFKTWSPIKGRLGISFRGDVGGFGIGNASAFAWQAWALLTWRLSDRWQLGLGYRVSYYDRITGSGANKNGSDLYMYGPMFGVRFVI